MLIVVGFEMLNVVAEAVDARPNAKETKTAPEQSE
jgi:hypothetical protein